MFIFFIFIFILFFIWIHTASLKLGQEEAIVILGYKSDGDVIHPLLQDRLDAALLLLNHKIYKRVIVSGGNVGTSSKSEAELMKDYLVRHGVHPDVILMDTSSRDTIDNLINCRHILEREDIREFLFISNSFHIRRIQYIAGVLGIRSSFFANRSWTAMMMQWKPTLKEMRIFYFTYKALIERDFL